MKESRWWPRCTSTESTVAFFCETYLRFWFVLPGSKYSQVYIIIRTPTKILVLIPTRCIWTRFFLACYPHNLRGTYCVRYILGYRCSSRNATHGTWVFPLSTNYVLFSLKNSHTSCYATDATKVTCQSDLPIIMYTILINYLHTYSLLSYPGQIHIFISAYI